MMVGKALALMLLAGGGGLPDLSANITGNNGVIQGGGNGNATATVSVTSGVEPYTYDWSVTGGSGTIISGQSSATVTVRINAPLGSTVSANLVCIISDTAGRQISRSVTVSVKGTYPPLTISIVSQSNGSASASRTARASGGKAPYTMSWFSFSTGIQVTSSQNDADCSTIATRNSSSPPPVSGNIRCSVTDAEGSYADVYSTVNLTS